MRRTFFFRASSAIHARARARPREQRAGRCRVGEPYLLLPHPNNNLEEERVLLVLLINHESERATVS